MMQCLERKDLCSSCFRHWNLHVAGKMYGKVFGI